MTKAPQTCRLTDLADLGPPLILNAILNKMFRRAGTRDHLTNQAISSLIRLTDNSILFHRLARESLLGFLENPQALSRYFVTVAHLEACVTNTRRALRFLDVLKRREGPIIDRELRKRVSRLARDVPEIRNVIEHIDDDLKRGTLVRGKPVALVISDDDRSLEIGDHSIRMDHLGALLRGLHAIAAQVADYSELRRESGAS